MFALIRILVLGAYIWLEARKMPLYTYMQVNWMGWPERGEAIPKKQLLQVKPWNGFMMNMYSIHLIMFCSLLKSLGQIWSHFLCLNFGLVEYMFTF